jgi:hypothetical protein
MATESEQVYFVSHSEDVAGKNLQVFYAPASEGLVVPTEVLRLFSPAEALVTGGLWKLLSDQAQAGQFAEPSVEPSSLDQVSGRIKQFLSTEPAGGIVVKDHAPDEIKQTLQAVEDALSSKARETLAEMLGIELPPQKSSKDEPTLHTGMYL